MELEFHCPKCNKKLFKYYSRERKFGPMIYNCKHCGGRYVDPRYHELAIDGIPGDVFNIPQFIVTFIIGALLLWRGIYLFGVEFLNMPDFMQKFLPVVITVVGIGMMIASVVEIILIKTGIKKKKYIRLYNESLERLKKDSYIDELYMLGYKRASEMREELKK